MLDGWSNVRVNAEFHQSKFARKTCSAGRSTHQLVAWVAAAIGRLILNDQATAHSDTEMPRPAEAAARNVERKADCATV